MLDAMNPSAIDAPDQAPPSFRRTTPVPEHAPVDLRFHRRLRLRSSTREVWSRRELVRILAEREFRVRYKQAVLGSAWAILTPLFLMLVFTVFFHRVAKVNTNGAPYPLFAYLGLLPWTFLSTSLSQGGQALINNVPLLNKVACPREVFPLGSIAVAGLDMSIATAVLFMLFGIYEFPPKSTSYWVPVLLIVQVAFTVGLTLAISAVIVYLRDLRHALPILLQLGLFATPVAYGIEVVPQSMRLVYVAINPLAAVIDGYRRAVLWGTHPDWGTLAVGGIASLVYLCGGYAWFKRLETGFADVA